MRDRARVWLAGHDLTVRLPSGDQGVRVTTGRRLVDLDAESALARLTGEPCWAHLLIDAVELALTVWPDGLPDGWHHPKKWGNAANHARHVSREPEQTTQPLARPMVDLFGAGDHPAACLLVVHPHAAARASGITALADHETVTELGKRDPNPWVAQVARNKEADRRSTTYFTEQRSAGRLPPAADWTASGLSYNQQGAPYAPAVLRSPTANGLYELVVVRGCDGHLNAFMCPRGADPVNDKRASTSDPRTKYTSAPRFAAMWALVDGLWLAEHLGLIDGYTPVDQRPWAEAVAYAEGAGGDLGRQPSKAILGTPAACLIATHSDWRTRMQAAISPHTPPAVTHWLTGDPEPEVRDAAAHHAVPA